MIFKDRGAAGDTLAQMLSPFANRTDTLVLGLPRGGVPVAFKIARTLHLPLDVFIVRKLGTPGQEELAMGAIASGGIKVLNAGVCNALKIPQELIEDVVQREQLEIERRELAYRPHNKPHEIAGRTIILVDDGLATGATMRAAVQAVKTQGPQKVIVAVPVAEREVVAELKREVDQIVCAATPYPFYGVGQWYKDFSQTSDQEVKELLLNAEAAPHTVPVREGTSNSM